MASVRLRSLLLVALIAPLLHPAIGYSQQLNGSPFNFVGFANGDATIQKSEIPAATLRMIREGTVYRHSYWQAGLLVGGVAGTIFGALLASGFCSASETASDPNCGIAALKGAILLGATGATAGALIGGIFSKPEAPPT